MSASGGNIKMSFVTDINQAERNLDKLTAKVRKLERANKGLTDQVKKGGVASKSSLGGMQVMAQSAAQSMMGAGGLFMAWSEINAVIEKNINLTRRANVRKFEFGDAQTRFLTKTGSTVARDEAEQSARNITALISDEVVTQFKAAELFGMVELIASATSTGKQPTERLRSIENIASMADLFQAFPAEEVGSALASIADMAKQMRFAGDTAPDRRAMEKFVGGQISELVSQARFTSIEGIQSVAKVFAQIVVADKEFNRVTTREGAIERLSEDFREAFAQSVAFTGGAVDVGGNETATALANLNSFLSEKFAEDPSRLKDGSLIDTATEARRAIEEGFTDSRGRFVTPEAGLREVMSGVTSRFGNDLDSVNGRRKMRAFLQGTIEAGRPINTVLNEVFSGNVVDDIDLSDPDRRAREMLNRIGVNSGLPAVRAAAEARSRAARADLLLQERFSSAQDVLFNQERGLVASTPRVPFFDMARGAERAFAFFNSFLPDDIAGAATIGLRRGATVNPLKAFAPLKEEETFALKELVRLRKSQEKSSRAIEGAAASAAANAQGQRESR